jgi:UDP-N-acetylmuramate--alanine ligase
MAVFPKKVHMVGIGGIGMSALAQLLVSRGVAVTGSDREESPTTGLLEKKGISVAIGHDGCVIPAGTELLVYSDAVWDDNPERMRAKDMGVPEISYFQALGRVSNEMRTIAVTGTHGKTTTTAMLAAILKGAGKEPTAVVGSIVRDFGSNFLEGGHTLVVEGCEYRNHVLELSPEILVITNCELDHTDFFASERQLQELFRKAIEKLPAHGCVITDPDDPAIAPIVEASPVRVVDYTTETVPQLKLLGEFNLANARAAKAAAKAAYPDITDTVCDEVLSQFVGSWRRFEYKGETENGATVYDDYAHHPTAIRETIAAIRERFPSKQIAVAFHPHLYSRTKSFFKEFSEALAEADEVYVAPIYAAREKLDPSVTHVKLAQAVTELGTPAHAPLSFDGIRDALESYGPETLVVTMGAGDIYKVAEQIVTA